MDILDNYAIQVKNVIIFIVKIGNKCLLRVMKTNLINGKDNMTYYISNLAEEILRLPLKVCL